MAILHLRMAVYLLVNVEFYVIILVSQKSKNSFLLRLLYEITELLVKVNGKKGPTQQQLDNTCK